MDQLIVGNIWEQANVFLKGTSARTAAIAYVTQKTLKLYDDDILICDASKGAIESGQTSAKTLKEYFENGVKVYHIDYLHTKFVYTSNVIICGSANMSTSSANNLVECAVLSQNHITISQAKAFVYGINNKNKPLTKADIDNLLKIVVVKRFFKGGKTKKKKNYDFGNNFG